MRILLLLIGVGFLLIGIIMLLMILKELIRGVFRFIALLGRLAVCLVRLVFRGIVRTIRGVWSLMRPVMSRAVASVASAYRFAADTLNRGVRRAAPRLAPHVERVQARAAGIMQRTWSGKDVLIIVLATLVAAPMITVLFVALVPVLIVVGAIVVLQAMFGGVEEKPATTAWTTNRAPDPPAPPPPPLPPPPPIAAACTPVACRRPKRLWRVAAGTVVVAMLLAGLLFVGKTHSVGPIGRRSINFAVAVGEPPDRARNHANAEWMAHVQAGMPAAVAQFLPMSGPGTVAKASSDEARTITPQPVTQYPDGVPAPPNVLVFQPNVAPPPVIVSNLYLDRSQAEDELLEQISGYVVGALESQGLQVHGWTPDRVLLRKNLVRNATAECYTGPNNLEQCRVTMELDLSLPKIEQVREWLAADYCWIRTKGTAQAYAGAVMMLGGLAIFLRLGTSRRPNE